MVAHLAICRARTLLAVILCRRAATCRPDPSLRRSSRKRTAGGVVTPIGAGPVSLDVVICTYNNAAGLELALAALGRQQAPREASWRVLVVDNNCTDDTAEVVNRHVRAGDVPDLRRVLEREQGLTPARRRGVTETLGDWIAFVDDDCLIADDWIAAAAGFASGHPGCGAFGGRVIVGWESPPPRYLHRYGWLFAEQDLGAYQREVDWLVGAGMVVNRSALQTSGWSRQPLLEDRVGTKLISGGDVEIALRIRGAGFPLWYVPTCELRHLVPARRTEHRYLRSLNEGLGVSQVLVGALTWESSAAAWLAAAVKGCVDGSGRLLWRLVGALRWRTGVIELAMDAAFVRGQWLGVWRLVRNGRRRRTLLGQAVR